MTTDHVEALAAELARADLAVRAALLALEDGRYASIATAASVLRRAVEAHDRAAHHCGEIYAAGIVLRPRRLRESAE